MTPEARKKIEVGHRYWTPRLALITVTLNVGGIALWYFVSNWMIDIKSEVKEMHAEMKIAADVTTERRVMMAAWKQGATDRIDGIDVRLVKVENRLGMGKDND